MIKRAFITGITGQDGSYLAEFLLSKGYEVHGLVRRSESSHLKNLASIKDRVVLHHGDMTDGTRLKRLVEAIVPDEIYNLAAQSHVRVSFDEPIHTGDVIALGTARLLEAALVVPNVRFYQASTSEMFGVAQPPQSESTPFIPQSPYGVAKLYAHYSVVNYRKGYGLHASAGILFNHESPRRGEHFATRKIVRGVAAIVSKKAASLPLGNIFSKRDWGYAPDFVEAMWMMLQQERPDDYVIATGESRSVAEFLDEAFRLVNLDWHDFVTYDPSCLRPNEVPALLGDSTKARTVLGWKPKVGFKELVQIMLTAELERSQA